MRRGRRATSTPVSKAGGLNENYARELLELHTLGMDGGYTQQDVVEVARASARWTIKNHREQKKLPLRAAHAREDRIEDAARPAHQGPAAEGSKAGAVLDVVAAPPSTAPLPPRPSFAPATASADDPPPAVMDAHGEHASVGRDDDLRGTMCAASPDVGNFLRASGRWRAWRRTPAAAFVATAVGGELRRGGRRLRFRSFVRCTTSAPAALPVRGPRPAPTVRGRGLGSRGARSSTAWTTPESRSPTEADARRSRQP